MKYKDHINSQLRPIANNVPYNKGIIKCANIFQTVSLYFTAVPKEVHSQKIMLRGYRGLKFRTDVFEPSGAEGKLPCLIYVHGGAFSYKASAYHKKLACIYAAKANCRVFCPDYHLAPKYPYPAAYEDVLALYKHLMKNAEAFEIDRERIGVAGDSAGASIAALICNNYEREDLKKPCIQMLVYPVTDADMQTDSMKRFTDTPLWNAQNNRRMWAYYCNGADTKEAQAASPMHSSLPRVIPDTYIETAEFDCLHDEGIMYGEYLQKAGANVRINETKGTIHGYDSALNANIAICNVKKRISFLRKGFILA